MSLKLRAEDGEDLKILSAYLQDALVRLGDIAYLPKSRRLALTLNRFCWEEKPAKIAGKDAYQRVSAGLHFDGVLGVKARGMDRGNPEGLLYLLAVEPKLDPDGKGSIDLVFAGGATLVMEVECLDVSLSDLGEPWLTEFHPEHADEPAGEPR